MYDYKEIQNTGICMDGKIKYPTWEEITQPKSNLETDTVPTPSVSPPQKSVVDQLKNTFKQTMNTFDWMLYRQHPTDDNQSNNLMTFSMTDQGQEQEQILTFSKADFLTSSTTSPSKQAEYETESTPVWYQFKSKDFLEKTKDGKTPLSGKDKIHISIDRNKIEKAYNVIIPILMKKKIKAFKVQYKKARNEEGKDFVIFISNHIPFDPKKDVFNEQDPAAWKALLEEIGTALKAEGIESKGIESEHSPFNNVVKHEPLGDVKLDISGEDYFYSRNGYNILNAYIAAEDLARAGFTALEAASIGMSDFFKEIFPKRKEYSLPPEPSKAPIVEIVENAGEIHRSFIVDMVSFHKPSLPHILFGRHAFNRDGTIFDQGITKLFLIDPSDTEIEKAREKHNLLKADYIKKAPAPDDSVFKEEIKENQQKHRYNSLSISTIFLGDELSECARLMSIACRNNQIKLNEVRTPALNCKENFHDTTTLRVGNIMPALYYYWFVPFVRDGHLENCEGNYTSEWFKKNKFPDENARRLFIKSVLMCSFRTRLPYDREYQSDQNINLNSFPQITKVIPQYINNLTEADVEKLVDEVIQNYYSLEPMVKEVKVEPVASEIEPIAIASKLIEGKAEPTQNTNVSDAQPTPEPTPVPVPTAPTPILAPASASAPVPAPEPTPTPVLTSILHTTNVSPIETKRSEGGAPEAKQPAQLYNLELLNKMLLLAVPVPATVFLAQQYLYAATTALFFTVPNIAIIAAVVIYSTAAVYSYCINKRDEPTKTENPTSPLLP